MSIPSGAGSAEAGDRATPPIASVSPVTIVNPKSFVVIPQPYYRPQAKPSQPAAKFLYVALEPVGVVVEPALEILEVAIVVGHRMSDDLAPGDVIALLKPPNEAQGRADLLAAIEDLLVGPVRALTGRLDHLDADRRLIEPDCVATADAQRDELVDRPILLDHEVRARAR